MNASSYKRINDLLGWLVFVIASATYVLTVEPTTSFWDCGEYIATSVKLQVGHPPGAPLFQLMGAVVANLLAGDVTQQAYYVNLLSAFSSSFTILFLFWSITAIAKRLVARLGEQTPARTIAIFGAGAVGALAYTFSDSFWFSAVEGEVYAMSSFFTALAFWAGLKWEAAVDHDPYANRWLLLVAYAVGLTVGVHILAFLVIPAVVMVVYYKLYKERSWKGFLVANTVSVAVLAFVFAIIVPFILKVFGFLEIQSVNTVGLPKNSGTLLAFGLFVGAVVYGIQWAKKANKPLVSQGILAVVFIMIGYSTFLTLAIRSNTNTPIDENNPEDAISLLAYYNREQYGDWPVLYGQSFNAPLDPQQPYKDGKPTYAFSEETGKYEVTNDGKASVPNYDKRYIGFFPRMWSDQSDHVQNYMSLMKITDKEAPISFGKHFSFFVKYQLGQLWFRYFMWNFAGRQNDEQNRYEFTKGNWITGISFWDEARLGPQDNLPTFLKNNPARNVYYALPLILGLVGLFFQFSKDKDHTWVLTSLFLFTGIAVAVYTNQKPFEPRERDYAFVGSFYVFAIWIGLGVVALVEWLGKLRSTATAALVTAAMLVAVPGLMAQQNWDDHNRSNRYTARDIAKAYLDSCEKNAILFTNGDNDTFPLWYVQEVEGYRTDVRIVNLSLLNTDWYIDMMKRKYYEGAPVPFRFEKSQYVQGTRDVLFYQDIGVQGRWYVEDFLNWTRRDDAATKFTAYQGTEAPKQFSFFPQKKWRIPVNKEQVLKNNVVPADQADRILEYIDWDWGSSVVSKRDLMLIDLLANNDWSRPIYFSTTVGSSASGFFWLTPYFRLEGLAYRFVPVKSASPEGSYDFGDVNAEACYNLMVNPKNEAGKFLYGNMEDPNVYLDETNRRLCFNLRTTFGRAASTLAIQGQNKKAIEMLDFGMQKMPVERFGYDYFLLSMIEGYFRAGAKDQANKLVDGFAASLDENLSYYAQYRGAKRAFVSQDIEGDLQYYQMLVRLSSAYNGGNFDPAKMQSDPLFARYAEQASKFQ